MRTFTLLLLLLAQDKTAKLAVSSLSDTPPSAFPGDALVTFTVTNASTVPGREATAKLTLGSTVFRVRLGDVDAGAEDVFEVKVPKCPEYKGVKIEPLWLTEVGNVPLGDFKDDENVDIAQIRLIRFSDDSLRITGKARNGTKAPIKGVKAKLRFSDSAAQVEIASMAAGATCDFELWMEKCPNGFAYNYGINYESVTELKDAGSPPAPEVRRTAHKDGPAPDVTRKPDDKKPDDKKPEKKEDKKSDALTIEVRGLTWVEGYTMINKKYSGWVSFLKIAIRDGDGKAVQPTGKFTASCFEGKESRGAVTRFLKKESYGSDASKIDSKNAAPEITAFDKTGNEVWFGIIRTDRTLDGLKLDVKIELDKLGTWEWKGLEDKFEAKAKAAEKK